ncbi:MAG: prolipoprotein diacylglyceryl transferase, partial [bacterium]
PIGNLLAPSGLTFYGGLIVAATMIILYAKRKKIDVKHLVDSAAPALMIAYAIGRMGCHIAGDGDWGVFNSAYTVNAENKVVESTPTEFVNTLQKNPEYARFLVAEFGSLDNIPHIAYKGADWLPNWFWAYNFPHNVNEVGVPIPGCEGSYCNQLIPPVFPTTLYEIIACGFLFSILWGVRKKISVPGRLFALYLMLNGFERFFIEKIRVNSTYDFLGFHPTQAEIISTLLVIGGGILWVKLGNVRSRTT